MALLDTFSCPRRPRLETTRALWARVGATGRAVVLSPHGVRLVPVARTCLGRGGWVNYVTTQRVAHGRAARGRAVPDAEPQRREATSLAPRVRGARGCAASPSGPWGEHPHVLGPSGVCRSGVVGCLYTPFVQEFRKLQVVWVLSLYEYILT